MENVLQLEILPSNNQKLMLVKDTSFWAPSYVVNNLILEIATPGSDEYVKISVLPGFLEVVSCATLGECCSGYTYLTDGVYKMKLSYNPNSKTLSYFYHLRTTTAYNQLMKLICDLKDSKCSFSRSEYVSKENMILQLDKDLRAAKWMVEENGDIQAGMNMYNDILSKLNNFSDCKC